MRYPLLVMSLIVAINWRSIAAEESRPDQSVSVNGPQLAPMSDIDRINLEANLRWIITRERERELRGAMADGKVIESERVAVFADAGVWHIGARSIVESLERQSVFCRVLDRSRLTLKDLSEYDVLILPGGWAPLQWWVAGEKGLASIQHFVENGGRCIGVCAGAYLLSQTTRYESVEYAYPLGLFDGVAIGPVAGLAAFPKPGAARLKVTDEGIKNGLASMDRVDVYYSGGPCFEGGTHVDVLARYADDSPAIITRPVGKGRVVLVGVHMERPVPAAGKDDIPPPQFAGGLLKSLCFPSR